MNSRELFQALEFAHYAERFRDNVFVIAFPRDIPFQALLLDIKVLVGYHIKVVMVVPDPEFKLEEVISTSNKRGTRLQLWMVTDALYGPGQEDGLGIDLEKMGRGLAQGKSQVIAYHQEPNLQEQGGAQPVEATYSLAAVLARRLEAHKLFLIGKPAAELEQAISRTHVTLDELAPMRDKLGQAGLAHLEPLLAFIGDNLNEGIPDIVLLEGQNTQLFGEVFTHDGAGILFNPSRRASIRQARVGDTTDIALLLRPEIEAGRILPVDEETVERNIRHFWIYEVDGLMVGVARLKPYGTWAELAHFSTLPRYRGKGRARDLALSMIEQARKMQHDAVFALSIDPRMWEFFQSLGFRESPREKLPPEWQSQYDFSRPSHAFLLELR
jgi:N-acetylglutamate synthase-like GNAT family acetyltransferase